MDGNQYEMRKVLEFILDKLMERGNGNCYCKFSWNEFNDMALMIEKSLVATARNCDRFGNDADTLWKVYLANATCDWNKHENKDFIKWMLSDKALVENPYKQKEA